MVSSIDKRLEEFSAFEKAMREQKGHHSELAQVLITASFLDSQLKTIIEAFFVEERMNKKLLLRIIEGPNAPVGTFSSRILMSYALGLINEQEYQSIEAIRSIRNKFAHELTTTFDSEKLTGQFDKLAWAAFRDKVGNLDRAEVMFLASVRLAMMLTNRADHVALERRTDKEWPSHRTDMIADNDFDHLDRDVRDLDNSWFADD